MQYQAIVTEKVVTGRARQRWLGTSKVEIAVKRTRIRRSSSSNNLDWYSKLRLLHTSDHHHHRLLSREEKSKVIWRRECGKNGSVTTGHGSAR
ncbi:unnamed protein product [Eruca vesicaria subsp. sativa]|uniref:Uncharacterized protein n=1 Tax=Eruca vesicaria subsp. sativa TaxID=29727 RepID=A0ABC8KJT7_ERUVS|nr:unnamed protein product [Eruca vesicaria subsp. sativa]